MKKNILLLLMTLVFFRDGHAEEETSFYAKVFAGANFLQNTFTDENKSTYQPGYVIAGSLGYRWCYGLRVEGEYAYRRNTLRKIHLPDENSSHHGHFHTSSYMANLLWDLPPCEALCNLRPFIGAGLGYDFQHLHASNSQIVFHQKWHHFAWQAIAGLAYPLFCNTEMTLEYRFHQGGCHFNNHSVGVGLEYTFGF